MSAFTVSASVCVRARAISVADQTYCLTHRQTERERERGGGGGVRNYETKKEKEMKKANVYLMCTTSLL